MREPKKAITPKLDLTKIKNFKNIWYWYFDDLKLEKINDELLSWTIKKQELKIKQNA